MAEKRAKVPLSTAFFRWTRHPNQVPRPRSSLSGDIQLATQLPFCPHRGWSYSQLMPGAPRGPCGSSGIVPASLGDLQSHARENRLVSAGLRRYGLLISCPSPIIALESSNGALAAAESDALLRKLTLPRVGDPPRLEPPFQSPQSQHHRQ
jgi:hypothetical protein